MNIKKMALLGGVGLASAAAGIAIPQMMSGQSHEAHETPKEKAEPAHGADGGHGKKEKKDKKEAAKSGGHGAASSSGHGGTDSHGKPTDAEKPHVDGPRFINAVTRTIINLNAPNLIKYLTIEVTVQVDADDEADVRAAIEVNKPILNTWLTTHLADKTVEDIRGKVGVNRLRREIQDNFNAILFADGRERIRDILFEEFHVE